MKIWLGLLALAALAGCRNSTTMEMPDGSGCMSSALRPQARKDVDAVLVPAQTGAHPLIYVYGGDEAPFDPMATVQQKQLTDELWRYDLGCGTWEQLTANAPGPRSGYAAALDDRSNRILIFGGFAGSGTAPSLSNDVWAYDLASSSWTQLHPAGTAPSARVGHRVVFDHAGNRLLLVGGDTAAVFGNGIVGDVWQLDFSSGADGTWTQLSASGAMGAPSPRRDVSLAVDPGGNRAVMFGGAFDFITYTDEVWTFDFTTSSWTQGMALGNAPSQRFGARMAFDSVSGQMVLFGGHDAGSIGLRNDTWELAADGKGTAVFTSILAGDSGLGVGGVDPASPERREKDGFAVESGTAWTFGGTSDCGPLDDAWTLDLTQPKAWTATDPAQVGETCARRAQPGQSCPSDCGAPL